MFPLYHPLNFYAKYAIIEACPVWGKSIWGEYIVEGIEVKEITPFICDLTIGAREETEAREKIEKVCHKYKHIFMEGYPCGRKTRKQLGIRLERQQNPGICLTYLVTSNGGSATVRILVSSVEEALKRYTRREILWFVQDFMQSLTEELI